MWSCHDQHALSSLYSHAASSFRILASPSNTSFSMIFLIQPSYLTIGDNGSYIFSLFKRAHDQTRTGDPVLTKDVLYLLSYVGINKITGAGNGTRTRDTRLGRPMLYQLSYSRSQVGREGFEPPKRCRSGFTARPI